jgi:hypothetical protein
VLESDGAGLWRGGAATPVALDRFSRARRDLRKFAPATRESARIGVEGPACVPLEDDEVFSVSSDPLPPGARLDIALHVGRPWPEAPVAQGQVEVLTGGRVLGVMNFALQPPGATGPPPNSREISGSLDLSGFKGQALDLSLHRVGAPAPCRVRGRLSISLRKPMPRTPCCRARAATCCWWRGLAARRSARLRRLDRRTRRDRALACRRRWNACSPASNLLPRPACSPAWRRSPTASASGRARNSRRASQRWLEQRGRARHRVLQQQLRDRPAPAARGFQRAVRPPARQRAGRARGGLAG